MSWRKLQYRLQDVGVMVTQNNFILTYQNYKTLRLMFKRMRVGQGFAYIELRYTCKKS